MGSWLGNTMEEMQAKTMAYFLDLTLNQIIKFFGNLFDGLMNTSKDVLDMPLVVNGTKYAQELAITLLIVKVMYEIYQTYIMYQSGDPEADPSGLLVRTAQAVAIIMTLPWIVKQIFTFGTKLASDVAQFNSSNFKVYDAMEAKLHYEETTQGLELVLPITLLVIIVFFILIGIQATIRGAELALMCFIGPVMALNITANNRSVWSAWFRQVVIICCSQALQVFMFMGSLSLLTNESGIDGVGSFFVIGWLWVTYKAPKFVSQIAYSTGLGSTTVGTAKQAGIMYITRRFAK